MLRERDSQCSVAIIFLQIPELWNLEYTVEQTRAVRAWSFSQRYTLKLITLTNTVKPGICKIFEN